MFVAVCRRLFLAMFLIRYHGYFVHTCSYFSFFPFLFVALKYTVINLWHKIPAGKREGKGPET